MSEIPEEIAIYGDIGTKPRQNPEFLPGKDFGTEDYFVWSRCDGVASLREIMLMVGFPKSKSMAILAKLRNMGAVLLPGENSLPEALLRKITESSREKTTATKDTAKEALEKLGALSAAEEEALAMELAIPQDARVRVLGLIRQLSEATHFEILEVDTDADKRSIKRAYFRISKEFHPDRYYGKEVGPFKEWLNQCFKAVNDAFKVLGDAKKRARYEAELRGDTAQQEPQTKEEHAAALYQNGCDAELQGELAQALKYFAAAIRMDAQGRYFRRAAMCAVSARELGLAEDYAKKAVEQSRNKDASYLRVWADVLRASARFEEAREVLEKALALDIENDILFGELRSDLASVNMEIADALAKKAES